MIVGMELVHESLEPFMRILVVIFLPFSFLLLCSSY